MEKFYKMLVQGYINKFDRMDLISENIIKIRKEIRQFFAELEKWNFIMKNFGNIITTEFDKNNFLIYDDIMETVNYIFLYN
jgi:hypothetical protein